MLVDKIRCTRTHLEKNKYVHETGKRHIIKQKTLKRMNNI